jgi:hypothetical protein
MLRAGILGGVDPRSNEYWGEIQDQDQRIVEAADVARVLWLTRARIWDTLDRGQKQMICAWLLAGALDDESQGNLSAQAPAPRESRNQV